MWRHLLDLLRAVRRPLVVSDYETCGLQDEPPVEMCHLVFAPWEAPNADADTLAARRLLPGAVGEALTCAVVTRLNPKRKIPAVATAVHRIADADVAGAPVYNDVEVVAFVRGLAMGDPAYGPTADLVAAGGVDPGPPLVGPAVWCGHNLAGFDLPRMRHWGYLDPATDLAALDVVDTDRVARRLQAEHPRPLVVDDPDFFRPMWEPSAAQPRPPCMGPPALGVGLGPFRTTLEGLRYALLSEGPDDTTHGALVDACLSIRVLHAMLGLWAHLWSATGTPDGRTPAQSLRRLLAALAAPPVNCRTGLRDVAWDGWLQQAHPPADGPRFGAPVTAMETTVVGAADVARTTVARGQKHRGRALADAVRLDRRYFADWLLGLPRAPAVGDKYDGQWLAPASAALVEAALGIRTGGLR